MKENKNVVYLELRAYRELPKKHKRIREGSTQINKKIVSTRPYGRTSRSENPCL